MHILRFIALHGIYYVVNFILFSLENDDMESSKRCVTLLSLISSFQLLKLDFCLFNIHVMMTFVDMAPKFGVMIKHQDSFFCARQPASSVNFRFGHSITKSYWLQFTLYTTADDRRSFPSYCRFCRGKRLVLCGLSSNRAAKLSLVVAFHYLPLPSCTLVRCLLHTNEVPSSIFISVNLEQ